MKIKIIFPLIILLLIFHIKLNAQYYSVGKVYGFACQYTNPLFGEKAWDKIAWVSNIVELDMRNKYYYIEDKPSSSMFQYKYSAFLERKLTNDVIFKKYKGSFSSYWTDFLDLQTIQKKRQDKINQLRQEGYTIIEISGLSIYQHPLSDYPTTNQGNKIVTPVQKKLQLNSNNPKTTNNSTEKTEDFWNTPENTMTVQQLEKKKEEKRQEKIREEEKQNTITKENALKKPFIWCVNNRDTVTEQNLIPIKNLNPYFNNGTITLSSVNKGKVTGTANNISTNLPLAEGWNTLRIALKGTNYNIKDSVKVYYKKSSRKVLLFDDFNDDINNGQNWKIIKNGINCQVSQSNSCLTLTVEYINNGSYQNHFNSCIELISKTLNIQPEKKLIFEIRYKVNSENRDYIEYDGETKIMRGNDYKFYFNFSPEKKYNYEKNCIRHQFSPISKDYEHGNFDLDVKSYSWGTHNFDGWFKIRDNIINGEWLNEKIIFNPNEKKISVYINNNFIDEGNPSPIAMNVLQFVFLATTLNYESYVIDYIKIYQE